MSVRVLNKFCVFTQIRSISHQKVEAFANYLFVASTEVKKAHDNAHNVTRSGIFIAAFQNLIISFHDGTNFFLLLLPLVKKAPTFFFFFFFFFFFAMQTL